PFQKVSDLVSTNTECDLQHFQTADFLAERRIKTRAALFDVSEMESRYVRDRLDVVVTQKVGVGSAVEILVRSRDGGNVIEFERLGESGAKVWIGCTPVAHEPASVHVEVHQVGEPADLLRSCRCAALQRAELIEVDRVSAFGLQVSVEERCVADFVDSVAGDVLWAVTIEVGQGDLVVVQLLIWVYLNGRIIAATAQFRVLYPKVRFDELGCSQESKNGYVALVEATWPPLAECDLARADQSSPYRSRSCQSAFLQEGAPIAINLSF